MREQNLHDTKMDMIILVRRKHRGGVEGLARCHWTVAKDFLQIRNVGQEEG